MESTTALINLLGQVKMAVSLTGSFDLTWKALSCLLLMLYLSSFVPRVAHVWSSLDSARVVVLGDDLPLSS